MGLLRLVVAPIRRVANSRLFQLVVIVTIILLLDHYSYDYAGLRSLADGLKILVTTTVQLCSQYFRIGMLTDPVLQVGLMIVYVYIVCLLIVYFFVVEKYDRSGARHCSLPRLAAVGENQTARHSAGKMGRNVCVAGRQ